MNVDKSHKKAPPKRPRRARASKPPARPIDRVPTDKLLESIKRDIQRVIDEAPAEDKPNTEQE